VGANIGQSKVNTDAKTAQTSVAKWLYTSPMYFKKI